MGRFMKAVRAGKEVVITDRDQPIARLVPIQGPAEGAVADPIEKPADPGAPPLGELELRAIRYRGRPSAELLAEDRARR